MNIPRKTPPIAGSTVAEARLIHRGRMEERDFWLREFTRRREIAAAHGRDPDLAVLQNLIDFLLGL